MQTTVQEVFRKGLGDSRIESIQWNENDLSFEFNLPGIPDEKLLIIFKNIRFLTIDFDFGVYIGQPLLFSASWNELPFHRGKVALEFGACPDGSIEFECDLSCETECILKK